MIKAKSTPYTCPVCENKKFKLLVVLQSLDYGDVRVQLEPLKGKGEKFWLEFDIRENNFYYCPTCRMRFTRIDPKDFPSYKDKRIEGLYTDCIFKECKEKYGGRIGTYKDVAVGNIYIKGDSPRAAKRRKRVRQLLENADVTDVPEVVDNFLQEFSGRFTLDQAGICNECGVVIAKEVDMK